MANESSNSNTDPTPPVIAVDVGNSHIKFGFFSAIPDTGIPEPTRTLRVPLDEQHEPLGELETWLADSAAADCRWGISSVNRAGSTVLVDWLRNRDAVERTQLLGSGDLPLEVRLDRPDMVGLDRLANAVATNRLRAPERPAVIIDVGSATTIDAVSADGAFLGGAILPGFELSARALHHFTDMLPYVGPDELLPVPEPLGTSTIDAMRSGLFWGAIGAARELVDRMHPDGGGDTEVILTGGGFESMLPFLSETGHVVPHLTVAGIALAAGSE